MSIINGHVVYSDGHKLYFNLKFVLYLLFVYLIVLFYILADAVARLADY